MVLNGFLRWQIFGIYVVVLVSIWWVTWKAFPIMIVALAPLWGLILLGLYAISWVVYGVVTLKDNPEAAKELEKEVEEAKQELRKRGILK